MATVAGAGLAEGVAVVGLKPRAHLKLNIWLLPVLVVVLLVFQLTAPHYKGWIILLVGLGGVLLISYLWVRSLAQGLQVTREMRFGWAQVGDRLEERFTLTNDGWVPALWVEVVDHSTIPGYEAGRGASVGMRDSVQWRKDAVCNRRGLFTVGPTTLLTSDPFGVFTVSLSHSASTPFLVMPPIVPLPTIEVRAGGRAGEGRPRANAPERAVSAASVRDYEPGDSLRWIHWRTSARCNSLFVRHFDDIPAGDWWILLNMDRRVHVGEGQDATEEHGVILAASLADRGLRLRRAVGLVAHGKELVWLPPGGGDDRRWEILRALASVSPGECTLSELLVRTGSKLGRYASLVIITPAADGAWVEALVPLLRRGAIPTVLLLDPASFGGTGDVRGMTVLLSDLGVAHYVITPDLLKRPEAHPGQEGYWEWRVLGTGRAVSVRSPRDIAWRVLS
jgi:uncharacterized protein (DUF58 family)